MKIQPYVEKLNGSSECKNFLENNPDAYIVAGFFVLDFEGGKNIHQIDYYVPKEKKVAAFNLDGKVNVQMMKMLNAKKVPEKLEIKTKVDLDALQGILEDEMKNRGISEEIKKIIAVLQTVKGKKIWNLNCILSGMEILRAHVEDKSKSVLKMERVSLVDIMKHIPGGRGLQIPETSSLSGEEQEDKKEDVAEKIKKLEDLEKELKLEKGKLEAKSSKKK